MATNTMNCRKCGRTGFTGICQDCLYPESFIDRFWANVRKSENGCWEWTARKNSRGYGAMFIHNKNTLAHRISWFIHHGELPKLLVCHTCDNPLCVNPAHLFVGTVKDNTQDMIRKGRDNFFGSYPETRKSIPHVSDCKHLTVSNKCLLSNEQCNFHRNTKLIKCPNLNNAGAEKVIQRTKTTKERVKNYQADYYSIHKQQLFEKHTEYNKTELGKLTQKRTYERRQLLYPERLRAKSAVGYALATGKMVKQPCEVCGNPIVEAHHDDYTKPLQVRWLCRYHHRETEGRLISQKLK